MGELVYTAITSLDGYVADRDGRFDWAAPDEEVHAAVNDLERAAGTHLYGRRLYEVMAVWQTFGDDEDESPVVRDYASVWRAAEKVVFSTTLTAVTTPRTRLERTFAADAVLALKAAAAQQISVGGPGLAAHALRAGLVDEIRLFVNPVAVGGGTAALPDGLRLDLDLVHEHRFGGGVVQLHYRVRD